MKKMSTKELAKKVYDKVIELGIENKTIALTMTYKYLRYIGVDCDLCEACERRLIGSGFEGLSLSYATMVILFNKENKDIMLENGMIVNLDNHKVKYPIIYDTRILNGIKEAQLFFAKVNTGMFKI